MQSIRQPWSVAEQAATHCTRAKQSGSAEQLAFSAQQFESMHVVQAALGNTSTPHVGPASTVEHSVVHRPSLQSMKLSYSAIPFCNLSRHERMHVWSVEGHAPTHRKRSRQTKLAEHAAFRSQQLVCTHVLQVLSR